MDVRKIGKDELELLSFNDIAYHIIKTDKESKTTPILFKEICTLLEMSDNEYEALIADFFTSLTTDKRFLLVNSTNWDLKQNHSLNIIIDEREDEYDDSYEVLDNNDDDDSVDKEEKYDLDEDGIDDLGDEDSVDDDDADDLDDLSDLKIIDEDQELEE
ncbi:MAG: DNA-directed RNA polymerase subunit delta [Bacilli bacterium]|nr:DNA-directed RNA polymerase subunit delta [Bacilli bacterium]MDD4053314.1 DNA-directed RNA polymerase subunit delta [Bacilli bacterium]MDD4411345.1 DNA-directed RNA polymerase subunit delta [Bacilli bacterium]